jgi:hypothetical protein
MVMKVGQEDALNCPHVIQIAKSVTPRSCLHCFVTDLIWAISAILMQQFCVERGCYRSNLSQSLRPEARCSHLQLYHKSFCTHPPAGATCPSGSFRSFSRLPFTPSSFERTTFYSLRYLNSQCALPTGLLSRRSAFAPCAKSSSQVRPGMSPKRDHKRSLRDAIRCPHLRDVCRNRALHPRHDVVYLKNAEGE